jgi:hypothetical protein
MKNILTLAIMAALLTAGAAVAQDATPRPTDPGSPQAAPTTSQPQTAPAPLAGSQTQAATQAATAPANDAKIAPGSVIPVQLTKTIDAKKAKTGDEVIARVVQDLKTQSGEVMVPKDTKVIGHVIEAQARQKDQKQSELAIVFDQAVLKDQPVSLPMSIQAVIGEENNNNNSSGASPSPSPAGAPMPSSTGTAGTSPMAGRSPSGNAGQSSPQGAPTGSTSGGNQASGPRPQINAQTQGVIGISNLNLEPNSNAKQGTMLSSEKNNVKLESGTMLLLRVNP